MPCFLPTFLIIIVMEVFACPDINFSPILVNYWICYHNDPDNCITDLYLLLYWYLDWSGVCYRIPNLEKLGRATLSPYSTIHIVLDIGCDFWTIF